MTRHAAEGEPEHAEAADPRAATRAPSNVAVAVHVLWITLLTAVFLLPYVSQWWLELLARKGVPGILLLPGVIAGLFYRDYVF